MNKKSDEEFDNINKDQDSQYQNPESFEEMLELLQL